MPLIFCTKPLFPDGFELTTCNAFGPFGPLQEDCNKEYLVNLSFSLSQSRKYSLSLTLKGSQNSVTRLGDFWKFRAEIFVLKVAQILNAFWGYFDTWHFLGKNYCVYFLGIFWPNFYPTSDHTAVTREDQFSLLLCMHHSHFLTKAYNIVSTSSTSSPIVR